MSVGVLPGRHPEDIWKTSGRHLEDIRKTSGRHPEDISNKKAGLHEKKDRLMILGKLAD